MVGATPPLLLPPMDGDRYIRHHPPHSPIGQSRTNDHASLHLTACYDDYCGVHHQMKNDNYYPQ